MEFEIYDTSSFVDSFGSETERLAMEINGCDVQVLRFDGDSDHVYVYVDNHAAVIPLGAVHEHILDWVG